MSKTTSGTHNVREDEVIVREYSNQTETRFAESRGDLSLVRYFWTYRLLLAKATAAGFALALVIAFLSPKTYKSTVQLMPPDSQPSGPLAMMAAMSGAGNSLGGFAGDVLGIKSTGALFVGVLRSRTVQESIVNEFDLRTVYRCRYMQDARIKLLDNTNIYEDRKSGILTIEITDRDKARAAAIGQAYVVELNNVVTNQSTSAARKERMFLEARLKDVQATLSNAEKELGQFSSKNATLDIKEQARTTVEASARLAGQLIATESELRGLQAIYTDSNVRVRTLKAQVANLRNEINKVRGTGTSLSDAAQGSAALEDVPSIRQLPILGVQYADLYRTVKVQETVFEILTKQYELAKVQEAKEVPTVKVLDAANIPEKKAGPPRFLLALLGGIIALFGCCGWLLLRIGWNRLDDDDARKQFLVEMYATVRSDVNRVWRRFRKSDQQVGY